MLLNSSITTTKFVDQFPHIAGQRAGKSQGFVRYRMIEAQFCRVERLPGKPGSLEHGAQALGGPPVKRIPQ